MLIKRMLMNVLISGVIVAVAHPLLLPLLLPAAWRTPYVQSLQAMRFPVGAAHMSFNMRGILTYVSAVHAAVVFLVMYGLTKDASRDASIRTGAPRG